MRVAPDGAFVRRLAAVAANLYNSFSTFHMHEKNAVETDECPGCRHKLTSWAKVVYLVDERIYFF